MIDNQDVKMMLTKTIIMIAVLFPKENFDPNFSIPLINPAQCCKKPGASSMALFYSAHGPRAHGPQRDANKQRKISASYSHKMRKKFSKTGV